MQDHVPSSAMDALGLPPLRERVFAEAEPVMVSICTITYNHAAFIRDCLEGFLDQVAPFRIEVVIYDDASDDGTSEIVREYAESHPSIFRAILNKENLFSKGVNPYYAYVFPAAKGKYIAICDGDDYWQDPEKLATQVRVLEDDPETSITYGRTAAEIGGRIDHDFKRGVERDLSAMELRTCPAINTLTACFRNPGMNAPLPYIRSAPVGDLTVWSILGRNGKGRFLPDLKPAVYRIHDGGIYSTKSSDTAYYMTMITWLSVAAHHCSAMDRASENRMLGIASVAMADRFGLARIVWCTWLQRTKLLAHFFRKKLRQLKRSVSGITVT